MLGKYTYLQAALFVFGAIFCLIYPLALVWPSGWVWHEGAPYASQYYLMIIGVYFTLGVFLMRAARNPAAHRSLIGFTRAVSDPLASDQPLWILVLPRFPSRRVSPPGSKTLYLVERGPCRDHGGAGDRRSDAWRPSAGRCPGAAAGCGCAGPVDAECRREGCGRVIPAR